MSGSVIIETRSLQAAWWTTMDCHLEKENHEMASGGTKGPICCLLFGRLFGRSTLSCPSCCVPACAVDEWTDRRACFSVLSRIVSHRRVLVSIDVQLRYNNIVTCKLPRRAQRRPSSPPSAPTTVCSFQFISSYIHLRSPSVSDDPT